MRFMRSVLVLILVWIGSVESFRSSVSPARQTLTTAAKRSAVLVLAPYRHRYGHSSSTTTGYLQAVQVSLQAVQVFDRVFSSETCSDLHDLSVDHAERCDSSIFNRCTAHKTPLEHVLDNLLHQLGDDCSMVEYWSRDEYMNIDAHCDIDERELENQGTLRFPDFSHVLYLQVATRGPTCILADQESGYRNQPTTDLVTVPAVVGRLLRFTGNLLHAVPKPAHRWLLTADEQQALLDEEQEDFEVDDDGSDYDNKEEDDWNDDDGDNDDYRVERSVLLFNTWSNEAPLDVRVDTATGALPDGIEIDGVDLMACLKQVQATQSKAWEEVYGLEAEQLRCNPKKSWVTHELPVAAVSESADSIRVNLMGKRNRRLYADKQACLTGSSEFLRSALEQETAVSQIRLLGD